MSKNQSVKVSKKALAKAYREAANIITEKGWVTGALERSNGVCALGGLNHALMKAGIADRLFAEYGGGLTVYGEGRADSTKAVVAADALRNRTYLYFQPKTGRLEVVKGLNLIELESKVIRKRFPKVGPYFNGGMVPFNDSWADNAEEVKSVLRGVAAALEHGGKV